MLGLWELVLIAAVLGIIFLPGLLKSRRPLTRTLRLYLIIAVLGIIILILSRAVMTLMGKIAALLLLLIAFFFAFVARFFRGGRKRI